MKTKLIITLMISVILISSTDSLYAGGGNLKPDYGGVFDDQIYDQTGVRAGPKHDQDALTQLYDLKERALTRALGAKLAPKLKILEDALKVSVNQQKAHSVMGIIKGIVGVVTAPLKLIPVIGSIFGSLDQAIDGISEISNHATSLARGGNNLTSIYPVLLKDIIDIKTEIECLHKGLYLEDVKNLEEQYVLLKHKMRPELQESIEEALIKTRRNDEPFYQPMNFVKQALKIPTTHKNLGLTETWGELEERFKSDRVFNSFGREERKMAYGIIKRAYFFSLVDDDNEVMRDSNYFHGNGGTGKTTMARYISTFLGLPRHEVSFASEDSTEDKKLYGSTRKLPSPETGLTADVFLKSINAGVKYKNTVLIINDADKLYRGKYSLKALTFFLNLLDPENKDFINDYMEAPIDWRRVIVIQTANGNFPRIPVAQPAQAANANENQAEDLFEPLEQRVNTAHFQGFSKEQMREELEVLCDELLGIFHTVTEKSNEDLVGEVLTENAGGSMRVWKKKLVDKVVLLPSDPEAKADDEEDIYGEGRAPIGDSLYDDEEEGSDDTNEKLAFISVGNDVIGFNSINGRQKWLVELPPKNNVEGRLLYGQDSNKLFVYKSGYTWALEPETGNQLWHNPLKDWGPGNDTTIAANDTTLFLGMSTCVLSLNADTGQSLRSYGKGFLDILFFGYESDARLTLTNDRLYTFFNGRLSTFNTNNLTVDNIANNRPKRASGNPSVSVNDEFACCLHDGYLFVHDANTLNTLFTSNISSGKNGVVLCDPDDFEDIYIATNNEIKKFKAEQNLPVKWKVKGGGSTLNLITNTQNKKLLVVTQDRMIIALDAKNGKFVWSHMANPTYQLNQYGKLSIVTGENGQLICGINGNCFSLSADGQFLWDNCTWGSSSGWKNGFATVNGKSSNCLDMSWGL